MIYFKSPRAHSGQTFIEVVLTVYMIGSLLSAILLLQSTVFSHVTGSVSRMSRMTLLEQYLYEIDLDLKLKKITPAKKTIETPPTTLTYKAMSPKEESALKHFKNISIVRLDASWDQAHRSFRESLIVVRHRVKGTTA